MGGYSVWMKDEFVHPDAAWLLSNWALPTTFAAGLALLLADMEWLSRRSQSSFARLGSDGCHVRRGCVRSCSVPARGRVCMALQSSLSRINSFPTESGLRIVLPAFARWLHHEHLPVDYKHWCLAYVVFQRVDCVGCWGARSLCGHP